MKAYRIAVRCVSVELKATISLVESLDLLIARLGYRDTP